MEFFWKRKPLTIFGKSFTLDYIQGSETPLRHINNQKQPPEVLFYKKIFF